MVDIIWYSIHSFYLKLWVHHGLRKIPIIREQKNSGCVPIQPADREYTFAHADEFHHCPAPFFVIHRCDGVFRLVEDNVDIYFGKMNSLTTDGDSVFGGMYANPEGIDNFSIDLDRPGKNQLIVAAPRPYARHR